MKKKIVLFLLAALVSAGLIISCGGDDPEETKKPGEKDPAVPTVQFTVTFDTNGGTPATIDPIKVNSGSASGSKWPDDPSKGSEYKFDGWFEGATEYTSDTKITKDVTVKAQYTLRPPKYLGGITWLNSLTQQGWRANGTDNTQTDLTLDEIRNAKYIVLHTKGGDDNTTFGQIKIALQSDVTWDWNNTNLNEATGTAFDRTKDNFIVLDISKLKGGNEFKTCVQGKFLVDYTAGGNTILGFGLQAGYLYYQALTKPTTGATVEFKGTVDGKEVVYGYVTDVNQTSIDVPTTFKTVTFDSNGGSAVASIQVGTGKDIGVKYPTWATKAATLTEVYVFDGWYSGSTEYTASSTISADITLKAKWKAIPLPTFNASKDITFLGKYTDGNSLGFGGYDGTLDKELFNTSKYLVLLFQGTNKDSSGFGGLQIVIQGEGNSYDWKMNESNGDTAFPTADDEFAFVVVNIANLADYEDCKNDDSGGAKFVLNYGFTNYICAWITPETLDLTKFTDHNKPGEAKVFFLTKNLGTGW